MKFDIVLVEEGIESAEETGSAETGSADMLLDIEEAQNWFEEEVQNWLEVVDIVVRMGLKGLVDTSRISGFVQNIKSHLGHWWVRCLWSRIPILVWIRVHWSLLP